MKMNADQRLCATPAQGGQIRARGRPLSAELPAWENDSSFQQLLLSFESILPLRQRSEFRDPKVHQRILSLTEGILVRICRLLETAASEAIRGGQEHISLALLDDKLVTESLISIVDRCTRRVSSR